MPLDIPTEGFRNKSPVSLSRATASSIDFMLALRIRSIPAHTLIQPLRHPYTDCLGNLRQHILIREYMRILRR